MTNFITRLTELAGPSVAAQLVAELGGQTVYLPRAVALQFNSPGVQLSGSIRTDIAMSQFVSGVEYGLTTLQANGINIHGMWVDTAGLGEAYLAELRKSKHLAGFHFHPIKQVG